MGRPEQEGLGSIAVVRACKKSLKALDKNLLGKNPEAADNLTMRTAFSLKENHTFSMIIAFNLPTSRFKIAS